MGDALSCGGALNRTMCLHDANITRFAQWWKRANFVLSFKENCKGNEKFGVHRALR